MIELFHLTKRYRTEEMETTALNDVSLRIDEGEFVSVMGPSGCGKSTLLNILGLLDTPSSGKHRFLGEDITGLSERGRAAFRKTHIGFVFQSFNLIDEFTVFENVELPLRYLGMNSAGRRARAEQALERIGLTSRRNHYPGQLSGGQQQRAAIARAIVAEPMLILADEPTGNLDSTNGAEVMTLLGDLNRQGTTLVMVTHSDTDARFSKRIVHLFDGAVAPSLSDGATDA